MKWLACGLALAGAFGCSSDDKNNGEAQGRYAMSVVVFAPGNTSTTYVTLVPSLDVTKVDTSTGREFGGRSYLATYNGWLFVSPGDKPIITRFSLNADNTLHEDGSISFANFGVSSVEVDALANTFVSPTKAYMLGPDGTHVVWNPTTLQLANQVAVPSSLVRQGYTLEGSSGVLRGNRLYRTFAWVNWNNYQYLDEQYLATYDTDNDTLISMVPETRCPALSAPGTIDEAGNIYFSNWYYNIPGVLQQNKPKSCAIKVPAGSDAEDPNWTLDFSAITGGHEGAQLAYTQKGKAVFAAFHQEAMSITPDLAPYKIASSNNWEAWSVDLNTKQAAVVPNIGWTGAQQVSYQLDGRTFILVTDQSFANTTAYELATDGSTRVAFTVAGWGSGFVKVQ